MPDEQNVVNPSSDATESELETLMREAERVATPSTDATPVKCSHAFDDPTLPTTKCKTCVLQFCEDCASPLDPQYCKTCLHEKDAELKELPLHNDEGINVPGRVLTPDPASRFYQPRFGTLAKTISEMSIQELENYIKYYQDLVRQAEKALDFRRVVLGTSQVELEQRKSAERRKLRADKTRYAVKTVTVNKATGKKESKGASPEDMAKMLRMLEALNALRKPTAAPTAAPPKAPASSVQQPPKALKK
jgi:hypothetical protein